MSRVLPGPPAGPSSPAPPRNPAPLPRPAPAPPKTPPSRPSRLAAALAVTFSGVLTIAGQWHLVPVVWLGYLHVNLRSSGRPAPAQHRGDVPPSSSRSVAGLSGPAGPNAPERRASSAAVAG